MQANKGRLIGMAGTGALLRSRAVDGNSQYVYYRTRNGTVQRAIVSPGSTRLGFSNVPSSIAAAVLSRLR